jgi:Zn-dependent metalloprotease
MRRFLPLENVFLFGILLSWSLIPFSTSAQSEAAQQKLDTYFNKHASKLKVETSDVSEMFITKSYVDKSTGIEHIYAQQRIHGIDVIGGVFSLHSSEKAAKEFAASNLVSKAGLAISGPSAAFTAECPGRSKLSGKYNAAG